MIKIQVIKNVFYNGEIVTDIKVDERRKQNIWIGHTAEYINKHIASSLGGIRRRSRKQKDKSSTWSIYLFDNIFLLFYLVYEIDVLQYDWRWLQCWSKRFGNKQKDLPTSLLFNIIFHITVIMLHITVIILHITGIIFHIMVIILHITVIIFHIMVIIVHVTIIIFHIMVQWLIHHFRLIANYTHSSLSVQFGVLKTQVRLCKEIFVIYLIIL